MKVTSASALRRSARAPCISGRVERARYLNGHDPLGAEPLRQLAGQGHGFGGARDDDLAGRVVVGHPDVALGAHAGRLGVVVRDAEERGHRPRSLLAGARHGLAASDHQADPVLEAEGAAGHQRRVLAETVAGAGGRREADPLHRVEHNEAEHGGGQLRVLGLGQLLDRGAQEEVRQVALRSCRGFLDHLPRRVVDPWLTHTGTLRSLSGEGENQHVSDGSDRRWVEEPTVWHADMAPAQVRLAASRRSRTSGANRGRYRAARRWLPLGNRVRRAVRPSGLERARRVGGAIRVGPRTARPDAELGATRGDAVGLPPALGVGTDQLVPGRRAAVVTPLWRDRSPGL